MQTFRELFEAKKPTVKEFKSLMKHIGSNYASISNMTMSTRSVKITPDPKKLEELKSKIENTEMFKNGHIDIEEDGGLAKAWLFTLKK